MFWITFIVYVVAVALYSVMCSGEKQWWSEGYQHEVYEDSTEESEESDPYGYDILDYLGA